MNTTQKEYPPLRTTKEWIGAAVMLGVCTAAAFFIIYTVPFVSALPEGTTAIEYVVTATVARFGIPVFFLLFLASLATVLAHNKGDTRSPLDFFAKLCTFGAATITGWSGFIAIMFA